MMRRLRWIAVDRGGAIALAALVAYLAFASPHVVDGDNHVRGGAGGRALRVRGRGVHARRAGRGARAVAGRRCGAAARAVARRGELPDDLAPRRPQAGP
jgi:hypothetical protein